MGYEIVGLCETGLKREINQDAVFWSKTQDAVICVVADGMGGHEHGEVASNLIKQTVSNCWKVFLQNIDRIEFQNVLALLKQELEKANKELFQKRNAGAMCGSTFVILFVWKGQYGILSAGDSRIYFKRGLTFSQMTIDEVWENQAGLPEEVRADLNHANRGKLVNAFGANANLRMQISTGELRGGEVFLLCSDGLYKMCSDKQIRAAMNQSRKGGEDMRKSLLDLKTQIEEAGARDNYSIIILKIFR